MRARSEHAQLNCVYLHDDYWARGVKDIRDVLCVHTG